MVKSDKSDGVAKGFYVLTVGVDRDTADGIRDAVLQENGTFLGEVEGYPPHQGQFQPLLRIQPSERPVCIIDFDTDSERAAQTAGTVRQMLSGRVTIMAVSEKTDPALILEAMRAGCSEYLSKPLVVEEVCKALARVRGQGDGVGEAGPSGRVLAFLGCRGGVGSTTLAVHLGTFLARYAGKKTLIVDLHPGLGHVALYLGHDTATYDFYDLVRNVSRLDQTLLAGYTIHHASGMDVIASPNVLNGVVNVSSEAIERTIRFLAEVYEVVLVDCPHGISELNLAAIQCCETLYLVATPDVAALRDLSRYLDRLLQCDVLPSKLSVIINRYSKEAAVSLEQIERAVKQRVAITVPNNPTELARALNTGTPLSADRRSEFTKQMKQWTAELAPLKSEQAPEEQKRKFSLWK